MTTPAPTAPKMNFYIVVNGRLVPAAIVFPKSDKSLYPDNFYPSDTAIPT